MTSSPSEVIPRVLVRVSAFETSMLLQPDASCVLAAPCVVSVRDRISMPLTGGFGKTQNGPLQVSQHVHANMIVCECKRQMPLLISVLARSVPPAQQHFSSSTLLFCFGSDLPAPQVARTPHAKRLE